MIWWAYIEVGVSGVAVGALAQSLADTRRHSYELRRVRDLERRIGALDARLDQIEQTGERQ